MPKGRRIAKRNAKRASPLLEAALKVKHLRGLYGAAKVDAKYAPTGTATHLSTIKDMVRAETKRLKYATR